MAPNFFGTNFNNAQCLLAIFNPATSKFLLVNDFGLRMFEMKSVEEFDLSYKSKKVWGTPPPEPDTYFNEQVSMVNTHGFVEREILYQKVSGTKFWGLLRIDVLANIDESLLLFRITNIDNLKNDSSKVVPDAQQLQALFYNSTIGMIITNEEAEIINFNPYAEKQFGYTKDEILGQRIEILVPQASHARHKIFRNSFIQHPQNRVMGAGRDLHAIRKDKSEFPVEISLSHYHIENKSYVIAFVIDISVRKASEEMVISQKNQLEQISNQVIQMNVELEKKVEDRTKMLKDTLSELEKSKEELRLALDKEIELGELKSRFVTMASHEFRTPLSTILTSAYIVQQYESADEQQKRVKHLEKIKNAVQVLTFILEDFLSLEKLETGYVVAKLDLVSEEDILNELKSIMDEMKPMLKAGQSFDFSHSKIGSLFTDKMLLRNILVNLISNASKYSPRDSVISITSRRNKGNVEISVTDRGIGIPEADQKHLFERFFRASNASTIQGTGLGLHIVSRYLKLINGDLEMKSELNKGTSFTILLESSHRN